MDETLKECAECGKRYVSESHSCGCPGPCGVCDGFSHHWMEHFEDRGLGEPLILWRCKHCPHSVVYGNPASHPQGCDCPDHEQENKHD